VDLNGCGEARAEGGEYSHNGTETMGVWLVSRGVFWLQGGREGVIGSSRVDTAYGRMISGGVFAVFCGGVTWRIYRALAAAGA